MANSYIEHLVLSGGGLLGISYIGLFKYFEETKKLVNIKSITGCSAGAIFGSLLAIGYNAQQLDTIVKTMIFKEYLTINVDSILNFTTTKGFETGKKLNLFIKKYIKEKTGDENITFLQIQEKYNIKLQIGVTNLTKSKFELFNLYTTPHVPIEKAISASIAIPFIFEPIIIGDDIFCDGGLLDNLPIENVIDIDNLLTLKEENTEYQNTDTEKQNTYTEKQNTDTEKQNTDTEKQNTEQQNTEKQNTEENKKDIKIQYNNWNIIGFYLINKNPIINKDNYKSIGISQYINLITHTLSKNIITKKQEYENINKNKYKIISIEIPCDIMTFIKLNATHNEIDNIIDIAYNITKKELNYT